MAQIFPFRGARYDAAIAGAARDVAAPPYDIIDAAGQKAAMRAFEDDQKFVSSTFVAVEPNGLDPCELRQQAGDIAVRQLIADRKQRL